MGRFVNDRGHQRRGLGFTEHRSDVVQRTAARVFATQGLHAGEVVHGDTVRLETVVADGRAGGGAEFVAGVLRGSCRLSPKITTASGDSGSFTSQPRFFQ